MSEGADRPRLYDDDEVSRLLKRASEIQAREGVGPTRASGFSLAELEEIASEAGIAPAHLRQAAAELEGAGPRGGWSWATGEPVGILLERVVPVDLPATAFEQVMVEIQNDAATQGQASLVGRTLTVQSDAPNRSSTLRILVTSRNGQTRIRIEERLHQLAGGLFGGIIAGVGGGLGVGAGVGLGAGVLGSALFAVAVPVGVIGASFFLARGIFSRIARRRQRVLADLMERLVHAVEAAGTAPPEGRLTDGGESP